MLSAVVTDVLPGLAPSSEEYYPSVAVTQLMKVLRDPSLSEVIATVTEYWLILLVSHDCGAIRHAYF